MSRYLLPVVMGLSVVIAGCKKQEPPKVAAKEVEQKVAEAASTAADYARQEKDEYVARAQKAVDDARADSPDWGVRSPWRSPRAGRMVP